MNALICLILSLKLNETTDRLNISINQLHSTIEEKYSICDLHKNELIVCNIIINCQNTLEQVYYYF